MYVSCIHYSQWRSDWSGWSGFNQTTFFRYTFWIIPLRIFNCMIMHRGHRGHKLEGMNWTTLKCVTPPLYMHSASIVS